MIPYLRPKTTRLDIGFDTNRQSTPDREAWKKAIGARSISARLELLPDATSPWNHMGVSASVQIALIVFFLLIPLFFPDKIKASLNFQVVELMQPVTEVLIAPPLPSPPTIKPKITPREIKPKVPEPVKLNPRQSHVFLAPKVQVPRVRRVEAKPVELNLVLEAVKVKMAANQPKRPKEDVKVGNLSSGSAAPATVVAPVNKVQTGGFGDPNGIPGKGDPNKATNVNRLGSPALPGGLGYGNGTGGDKGIRGTAASTGFGNGTANPPPAVKHRTVQTSGFGDPTVDDAPKKKVAPAESATTPVNILDKPHPEYTAEGRSLKLEGDVVIDLVFLADGTVQVKSVLSGIGHGLDESAIRAARQIKFKPAKRDGQPVDFPARVRIEFRLAY